VSLFFRYIYISFKDQNVNLKESILSMFPFLLTILIYNSLWKIVFNNVMSINEIISTKEALWYIILVNSLMNSMSSYSIPFSEELKNGELAYSLSKPVSPINSRLSIYFGKTMSKFLLNLFVGSVAGILLVGAIQFSMGLNGIIQIILLISGSIMLSGTLFFFFQIFSVWINDSSGFLWFYQKSLFFFGGLFFPLVLYPKFIQEISNYLPFQYILNKPITMIISILQGFTSDNDVMSVILTQYCFLGVFYLLTVIIFKVGKKRMASYGG